MPSYTVTEKRNTSFRSNATFDGNGRRRVTTTITQPFLVKVSGASAASAVSELDIAALTNSLPTVGLSTFYSSTLQKSLYNAICTAKTIKRNKSNAFYFDVDATYSTGPMDEEASLVSPVASVADIGTQISVGVSGKDRVLYSDLDGNQCWQLPEVKVPYSSPVVTQDPEVVITVEQYEAAISYAQIQDRSFVVNNATYSGFPAGELLCRVVSATSQQVQLSASQSTVKRVTYELRHREGLYYDQDGTVKNAGWRHMQPLVSPKYIANTDASGATITSRIARVADDNSGEEFQTYINTDGTKRTTGSDRPAYILHRKYPSATFTAFLPSSL